MSGLGEVRAALGEALAEIPERIQVSLVGGKYDEGTDKFAIRILAGEPSEEAEARLDELLAPEGPVLTAFELDPTLGGAVSNLAVRSHVGHRAFEQPDRSVLMGTEVLIEVYR